MVLTVLGKKIGMGLLLLLAGVAGSWAPRASADLVVGNVQVQQRPFTALFDVTYDLQTVDDAPVEVTLFLSTDGGTSFSARCLAVTGDVGDEVAPGTARHLVWDAGADFPGLASASCLLRVVADDHQGDPQPPPGFVHIAPGTFLMGSPLGEPGRYSNETQHEVTLTRGFFMARYEVTEQLWYEVMGGTPSALQVPKTYVSWDSAVQFCNALSLQEGLTPAYTIGAGSNNVTWDQGANGYRLPTEAEFEYACRAGATLAFHNDTNCLSSDTEANYNGTLPLAGCATGVYRFARTVVGSFPANPWGLCDMHGNLQEWVWDCYRTDYQNLDPVDPVHDVGVAGYRVFRGGRWNIEARSCRSAYRYFYYPGDSVSNFGFRPVRWAS